MAMLRIGGITWLHGCLRLTSQTAMPACSRDSGEDGGCPSQMACDDEFWLRLGSVHPVSLALSSWAWSCPEDSRASCHWASQDPMFLFTCATQLLSAAGHSSQRSAMLLLRHAASLAAEVTWTGRRSHEEHLPCLRPASLTTRKIDPRQAHGTFYMFPLLLGLRGSYFGNPKP